MEHKTITCDRAFCGVELTKNPEEYQSVKIFNYEKNAYIEIDLCPKCLKEFKNIYIK